jgi:2-deoxy-D-gluconate 3-dehydrogenase
MLADRMGLFDLFSLKGKAAIVTGAAKTTGLCYDMAVALHDAGAKVVLVDISPEVHGLAKTLGGDENNYYAIQADITRQASREAAVSGALELLGGRLDILLNGAGIQFRCDAVDFPEDKFRSIIDINMTSLFFMCQLAGKIMLNQGSGKIINIASMTSFMASRRIAAYAASKGAVMQLTKALSNEWAGKGINVNAIAPGYMATELTADMINTEQGKAHTARIPMGRWGKPEDLRGVTVFLASAASDYISGAIIPVDGGYLGA